MASLKTLAGTQLLIQVGDGADPENFAHDCLINASRSAGFSVDTNGYVLPDCDNPEAPGWKTTTKDGMSCQISGSGKMHTTTVSSLWFAWFTSSQPKNVRINVNAAAADGGGYLEGSFHLTALNMSGERNALVEADISLESTGEITWTAAS